MTNIDKYKFSVDLAKKLDLKDGKQDNKISAEIWNDFASPYYTSNSKKPTNYISVFSENSDGSVNQNKGGDGISSINIYLKDVSDKEIESLAKTYGITLSKTSETQSTSNKNSTSSLDNQIQTHKALKVKGNVDISNLNDNTKNHLLSIADDLQNQGLTATVVSAYRSPKKQSSVMAQTPATADTPSHSQHVKGNAFDIHVYKNGKEIKDTQFYIDLARNHGIYNGRDTRVFDDVPQGTKSEYWHFQTSKGDGHLFDNSLRKKHPKNR